MENLNGVLCVYVYVYGVATYLSQKKKKVIIYILIDIGLNYTIGSKENKYLHDSSPRYFFFLK